MFHTNSTDDPSNSWKAYTEEEMEETTLRWKEDICKVAHSDAHQGHRQHRLHPRETEGACACSTPRRTELLHCLRSSQGGFLTMIHHSFLFIHFSILQPHQPWDCPAEFYDLYPEDVVGLPANPYVPEVRWATICRFASAELKQLNLWVFLECALELPWWVALIML